MMQRHMRLATGLRLLQQGLLRPEQRASCVQLLQHRDASYRAVRERSRGGAARASWGSLNSSERQTVRGSGGSRDWRGGGGGYRDRQSSRGGGGGREWQRGGRDEGGRGGSGRERGGERWGSDRAPDRRRGPGFGAQSAPQWDDRDERGWEEEEEGDWEAAGSSSTSSGWRSGGSGGRFGGGRQQQDRGGRRGGWGQQREGEEEEGGWAAARPPSLKEQWVGDYVYGVSPVLAALRAGRREVTALYMQEGMQLGKRKDKAAVQAVRALAQEVGASVVESSKHDLNMVTDNRPHQGLVLDCSPLEFETLTSFPEAPASGRDASGVVPLWLCLDEVMDPQNFGAALRSAFFLGAAGVVTCHRNSAPLSAVVSKASAGAMELMAVHSVKSMPQALADAKRKGWQVLGAAAEEGAVAAGDFVLDRPSLLVVGNEGYGVRPVIKRLCDATLRIDGNGCGGGWGWGGEGAGGEGGNGRGLMPGAAQLVDSLNVSVATGILLHQLINSSRQGGLGAAGGDS